MAVEQQAPSAERDALAEVEWRCSQAVCTDDSWDQGYYALAQEILAIVQAAVPTGVVA